MSEGNENYSSELRLRFSGEGDESPADAPASSDTRNSGEVLESADVAIQQDDAETGFGIIERDETVPAGDAAGIEVLDADTVPSLSEILKELEAQDLAEAEAVAKARSAPDSEVTRMTRGERAAAALAHQALSELAGLRAENGHLRSRAVKAEADKTDALDRLLRLQADFEILRKRTDRDRGDIHTRLVVDVARKLLPVIDNLTRALKAEDSFQASESEEFRHFLGGVGLIFKQLNDVLEGLGIEAIPAVGQPFDPHFHEAVATEPSDEVDPDVITQELARGYRLGDKLLRPSMVMVSIKS